MTVRVARDDQSSQTFGKDVGRDPEVDEARTGDLGALDAGARIIEAFDDRCREVARLEAELLGEDQRQVRSPVAERRIPWPLENRVDISGRTERVRGASQLRAQQIRVRHYDSLFPFDGGAVELEPAGALFASEVFLSDDVEDSLDFDSD